MNAFMIQSNGLTIDITQAIYKEGTVIQGYTPDGGGGNPIKPNQSWRVIPDPLGTTHHIIVSEACNLCIGIGANAVPQLNSNNEVMDDVSDRGTVLTLQAQEPVNNNYQLWDFLVPTGSEGNAVFIQNPQTGYVIELQSRTDQISPLVANTRLITNESYQLWTAVDKKGNEVIFPVLPMAQLGATLQGSSNYVFLPPNQGDHLVGITVTIDIAKDLVVQAGCSVQINCNTPYLGPSVPYVSSSYTPAETLAVDQQEFKGDTEDFDRQAQWMQFGVFVQNNQLVLFNQFWHRLGPIAPSELTSKTETSPSMLQLQNNTIPAGTRIVLNICTDQDDFAIGMAGMVLDSTGMIMGNPVYWPAIGRDSWHSTIDGGKIHQRAMAPIGAFQVVFCSLPGQPTAQFTLGTGTITVTASPGIAAQNYWPNPFGGGTAENSNMPYDLVQSGTSRLIAQPFGISLSAARGSALTSFALNGNATRLYYLDNGGWVHEFGWTGSGWEHTPLRSTQGSASAVAGSALTSFALNGNSTRLYYLDNHGWVHELGWTGSGWEHTSLRSTQGSASAVAGSALTSFALNGNSTRLYYLDNGGWVHELGWTGSGWEHTPLQSQQAGVPAARGSALTSFALNGNATRLYYLDNHGWVHELGWTGSGWEHTSLRSTQGSASAVAGSALTSFALNGNSTRLYYLDNHGWVHELGWTGSGWEHTPLRSTQGSASAVAGSALTSFALNGNATRLYYLDNGGWVHELGWTGSGWEHTPLQSTQGSAPAVAGSALTSFALNGNSTRLYYLNGNGGVNELGWTGSGWEFTGILQ